MPEKIVSKLIKTDRKPYTTIYLIRHCHPNYELEAVTGSDQMPLSKEGLKQRKFLTKKLLTLDIERIYSSKFLRAKETAALFSATVKKRVKTDDRFNEIDWLDWYRVKFFNIAEKNRSKHLKNYQKIDKKLDKFQADARKTLAHIYRENKGKTIAIFSHGNFIKTVLTGILNTDIIGFLSLEIFQSSVSKIMIDQDGVVKISGINNVDHLLSPPQEDLFLALKKV